MVRQFIFDVFQNTNGFTNFTVTLLLLTLLLYYYCLLLLLLLFILKLVQ